ncbi:hypothetical protein RND81_14G100700 [Saponaria officinalis]|uniref:RING-type E3 ubiquitin transferase n=1 Tax=Saponaria officinalis TaxID=3572 RepID=A0AAW1GQI1_SAPOF
MKQCPRLTISRLFFLFVVLYSLNYINGQYCSPNNCPKGVNRSASEDDFAVRYPFRLKDQHSRSCGKPGFELYCDKTFGTLIQLPNNVVFRVDFISYYNQYITLSDPYNCLPRNLMSLNLTNSPFKARYNQELWMYNCSGEYQYMFGIDRIDCLSGSGYTVIGARYGARDSVGPNCSFVKILKAPKSYYSSYYYSSSSSIDLTWAGQFGSGQLGLWFTFLGWVGSGSVPNTSGLAVVLVPILIGVVIATLLVLCCYCCRYQTSTTTVTNTNATIRSQRTHPSTTSVVVVTGGLDQVTIDSYPVVVLGETGSVLKSDDETCSICLSDYQPRETLKILPECLHRFHKDCIDPWLRSKEKKLIVLQHKENSYSTEYFVPNRTIHD